MKHFIYLNQRNLYSFYAQAFDGLEKERQTETSDTVETGKTRTPEKPSAKLSAALKTPFLDAQAEIGSDGKFIESHFAQSEVAREIVTQALHDNAFSHVVEYAKDENLLCNPQNPKAGKYVHVKGNFQILDWDLLLSYSSKEAVSNMVDALRDETMKNLSEVGVKEDVAGREAKRKSEELKRTWEATNRSFLLMKALFPFNSIILMDGYLVPLKKEGHLETTAEIAYAYGEEINVFGRVVKEDARLGNSLGENALSNMYQSLNTIVYGRLEALIGSKKPLAYVIPIAAFFE